MICTSEVENGPNILIQNTSATKQALNQYLGNNEVSPIFFLGEALSILKQFPNESIDMCMTSPPYWNKRRYQNGGIGIEDEYSQYISSICEIVSEVKRVLKPSGSFWLNIGDTYLGKGLVGIPWRIAIKLMDEQHWILRDSVVWNKLKGGLDNTKDRLRNVHENLFHFVQIPKGYYFNVDSIRGKPRTIKVVNGAIISATGVSGVKYKRQIELSTALTNAEKEAAFLALNAMLGNLKNGEISDFRMVIRNQQRTTHSDSEKVSGRAKEIKEKGFYFLKYHPNGSKLGDVWDIIPEDTQKREGHFAPYPIDLCKVPILATCPQNGVVLDPFCGTGTTMYTAKLLGRKSVGIDLSREYLESAESRCSF